MGLVRVSRARVNFFVSFLSLPDLFSVLLPLSPRFLASWLFLTPPGWTFCPPDSEIILRPLRICHLYKLGTLGFMVMLDSCSKVPFPGTSCLFSLEALVLFSLLGTLFFKALLIISSLALVTFCFLNCLSSVLSFLGSTFYTLHESQPVASPVASLSKYFHDICCHLCFDNKPTFLILAVRHLFYMFNSY